MTHKAASPRSKSIRIVKPAPVPASPSLEEQRPAFPTLVRSREGRVLSEARYRNGESFALAIEERFGAAVRHAGAQAGDVIGKVRVHEATVCAAADLHIRTDSAPLAAQEAQDEILALLGGPLLE